MTTEGAPRGRMVELAGGRRWVHRSGSGGPPVVFLPGAGSFGLDFFLVHQMLVKTTVSVLYDRAGTGWSDDADLPRTCDQVTDELQDLRRTLEVGAPFVLVGHSLGALHARRYAQRFPAEVAGLLLLDPAHEDWDRYLPDGLKMVDNAAPGDGVDEPPDLPAEFLDAYRGPFDELFAGFPGPVRQALVRRHLSPERLMTGYREGTNVLALFDELRAGGPVPDVPTIILSASGIDPTQTMLAPPERVRAQIEGSQRLYEALAAASPLVTHRSVVDASHVSLPLVRPDAVAAAVDELIGRSATVG